jgi:hypothetical protein
VNEEASIKVLEIEATYNKLRAPIYEERNRHLRCLPDFWATALSSHHDLQGVITERDHQLLGFLRQVGAAGGEGGQGGRDGGRPDAQGRCGDEGGGQACGAGWEQPGQLPARSGCWGLPP